MLDNVVEKLSARNILHHHEDVRRRGDHLVELDDVRVAEELQILNLAPDLPHDVKRLDLLSVEDFDGDLVASHLVESH